MSRRLPLGLLVAVLAAVLLWWGTGGAQDPSGTRADELASEARPEAGVRAGEASGLPVVALADLPPEAAETVALIDAGGPFPYPGRDGSVFNNFEELLPDQARGYYREYTVPIPGSPDRGARRIVAGLPGELYWTPDHYDTFEVIRR
jgi:ribonuclease T1